jgi:hypothetical protein
VALVRIGAPCFNAEVTDDARVEFVAPRFTREDRVPAGRAPEPVTLHVANGAAPLILILHNADTWRLTGATERVRVVMLTRGEDAVEGAPDNVVRHAPRRGDNPPWIRTDRPNELRCMGIFRAVNDATRLPIADAQVHRLTGRHLSDFHNGRDELRYEIGRPDWRIRLDRVFGPKPDLYDPPDYDRINARRDIPIETRTGVWDDELECLRAQRSCQALKALYESGAIRFATNRDRTRWEAAARRHSPIRHIWTPTMGQTSTPAFTILREITLPSGMAGAHSVTFFIDADAPLPQVQGRSDASHNMYFDLADGAIYGQAYSPLPDARPPR